MLQVETKNCILSMLEKICITSWSHHFSSITLEGKDNAFPTLHQIWVSVLVASWSPRASQLLLKQEKSPPLFLTLKAHLETRQGHTQAHVRELAHTHARTHFVIETA